LQSRREEQHNILIFALNSSRRFNRHSRCRLNLTTFEESMKVKSSAQPWPMVPGQHLLQLMGQYRFLGERSNPRLADAASNCLTTKRG
jgi:hypothetical protein